MPIVNGPSRSIRMASTGNSPARAADRGRMRSREPFVVTRERILAFARLTHNDHPVHRHEGAARDLGYPALVAPPTFATLAMMRTQDEAFRILAPGLQRTPLLHTRQTLHIRRLLVAGDVVTTDFRIHSVRTTSEYAIVEADLVLTDQNGEIVQSGTSALHLSVSTTAAALATAQLSRGRGVPVPHDRPDAYTESAVARSRSGRASGLALPPRSFPMGAVEIGPAAVQCDPRDAPWAAGSGTGPPTGMMRLALTAGYLSSCLGDPAAVSRYDAEFTHFAGRTARVAHPVDMSGRVVSVDPAGAALVEIDGRCLDRRLFIAAHAVVRPPAQ